MSSDQLISAKKLFFTLLVIDAFVTAIVGLNAFSTVGVLREVQSGVQAVDQSMISSLEFWDNFSKLIFLTIIGVGIGLIKWLNACYRFAKEKIGATGFKNESWTVAGWIIPFFNMFKPYQIINEIYKAGSNAYVAADDWKKESGSGALLTWWVFYVVIHFIGWSVTKQMISISFRDDFAIPQAIKVTEWQAWLCIVSLLNSGLWFWVANLLTQRMLDRKTISASILYGQRDLSTSNSAPISQAIPTSTTAAEIPTTSPNERREEAIGIPEFAPSRLTIPIHAMPESDDWAFEKVAGELHTNTTDKVLWTRVFAESGGDENKTKALYIQRRVKVLVEAERNRLAEEHARAVELKRQRDVQAELIKMRKLKAQQEEETRRREAEAFELAEREKAEAAARTRQAEEQRRRRHDLQEANFDALEKAARSSNPKKRSMAANVMFATALGIAVLFLIVINSDGGPDYKRMSVTELQAKAASDPTAAYHLMRRYHRGIAGVSKDMSESLRWGEIAANAGHARAQAMVGWYYSAGIGAPEDKQKGLMWLEKAAAQNDAMGLSNLGWRYQTGDGVPLDYQKAFDYAKRASDLGDEIGRNNLAELYEKGHGVPKDYAKALELFEPIAIKESSTDSRLGMIRIFADQSGQYYYPVLAYAWLRIALDKSEDKEELSEHLDELAALRRVLESRLTPEQIEAGRVKSANWKRGDNLRP